MHALIRNLVSLFPPDSFSLMAVILGMPLLGALVNGIWGKRLGKPAVRMMALSAVGISFVASILAFLVLSEQPEHEPLAWTLWDWMRSSTRAGGSLSIPVRFSIDRLSGVMMLVVTGVGSLIHLYASSYMSHDEGYHRFFSYLNLFIFSMLVLILGDNLPILFVGWEGVGLCSYLLIGFWHGHMPNAAAGRKAFIANRIGDFGLLCGMFLLVYYVGSLDWKGIESGATSLLDPSMRGRVHLWPPGGGSYTGIFTFLQPKSPFTISAATAVCLAIFLGCTGKSAQIPLYVWLPDAMAGPTPVSALIHAATMVTAGIYLICRLSFLFVLSPFAMTVIACTGAGTALLAASIALVQNDIKKVLAYSTVSQLGFMFLGVGVGAFTAGFFHVFTHAFFKACLFLAAGSVIHAMHAQIHDSDASQDMRNMGGLKKFMPVTFWTFLVSTLAIVGCPPLSGFFSKDEILFKAFANRLVHPYAGKGILQNVSVWTPPEKLGTILFAMALLAAVMTAFYMGRALFLTFFGEFRGWNISDKVEHAAHGEGGHGSGPEPHESPRPMTIPLIVLAAFALVAGALNLPHWVPISALKAHGHGDGHPEGAMDYWLSPIFESAMKAVTMVKDAEHAEMKLLALGVLAFGVGTGFAYWVYVIKGGEPANAIAKSAAPLHRILLDKWRIDELYGATIVSAVDSLAETSAMFFDKWIVDGILARLSAAIVQATGIVLRAFQTGVVHMYSALMVVGIFALGWFFAVPHAAAAVTESGSGDYVISAGPGTGYRYRWDTDGNGTPDESDFSSGDAALSRKVHLEVGKSQTVTLEVRNALGLVGRRAITLSRPAESAKKNKMVDE